MSRLTEAGPLGCGSNEADESTGDAPRSFPCPVVDLESDLPMESVIVIYFVDFGFRSTLLLLCFSTVSPGPGCLHNSRSSEPRDAPSKRKQIGPTLSAPND